VGKLGNVGIFAVHVFHLRNVGIISIVGKQRNVGLFRDVGIVRNVGLFSDVGFISNVGEQRDVGIFRNVGQQRVSGRTELTKRAHIGVPTWVGERKLTSFCRA
jgi:hypothetical protein